jgi:hypothetical protein
MGCWCPAPMADADLSSSSRSHSVASGGCR